MFQVFILHFPQFPFNNFLTSRILNSWRILLWNSAQSISLLNFLSRLRSTYLSTTKKQRKTPKKSWAQKENDFCSKNEILAYLWRWCGISIQIWAFSVLHFFLFIPCVCSYFMTKFHLLVLFVKLPNFYSTHIKAIPWHYTYFSLSYTYCSSCSSVLQTKL
jgi:hypothetical protein